MLRLTSIGSDDDDDTDGVGVADKVAVSEHRRVHMTWTKDKALELRAQAHIPSGCSTPEGFRDMLSIRPCVTITYNHVCYHHCITVNKLLCFYKNKFFAFSV